MSSASPTAPGATATVEQPSIVVTSFPDSTVAATHEPGASLLTKTCATPEFTLLKLESSAVYAPFVGCVNTRQDCCPSQPQTSVAIGFNDVYPKAPNPEQAALERCPADYYSISARCCPNGYTLWTTDLGGQTPCFSVLQAAVTPPPITNANSAEPTVVVSDVVYAIGYPVQEPLNSFPAEAIAGIVATVLGLLVIAGLALFLHKRRQRREFLNLGNELNDLYGPKQVRQPSNTSLPGVQASGSSSFQDDRTIVEDGAYSRKSEESDRSHPQRSPFDGHQFVVPPAKLLKQDDLKKLPILERQPKQQASNQGFKLRVQEPDQQATQHEQSHSHMNASEHDLPTPSPVELDKPQLPALSQQEALNADDIVNTSNSGDDTFASTHSGYHSGFPQGLTVETARPERLSRAYAKVVYTPPQTGTTGKPANNTEEHKDDEKSSSGEEAK
ncbi:hypothetical protein QBC45DRAFT_116972 [Copromyces sp. CBS 386.78]|nr:hypothetical protein QBC45DRAFT_116972 [Copromyces sp. CBS 386.78]